MIPMLATIDDTTARKVDEDRKIHGVGYLRVRRDGRIEHVPYDPNAPVTILTAEQTLNTLEVGQ